jgi:hypothetical protein
LRQSHVTSSRHDAWRMERDSFARSFDQTMTWSRAIFLMMTNKQIIIIIYIATACNKTKLYINCTLTLSCKRKVR